MKNNRRFLLIITVFGLIIYSLSLSGCAPAKLYSVNMSYDASQAVIPAYLKAEGKNRDIIISVAEFTDTRRIDDKKIIGRVIEKDGTNVLVFPKYVIPTQAVSGGIKEYFKMAGYKVADKIVQWDLKEETWPPGMAKLLIGGSVDGMEIRCRRGFPSNSYTTSMKLTIVFADMSRGHIVYTRKVEATSSQEHVSFTEERMGYYASDVLGEAIKNVFEDKAVAQKLKEVVSQ